MSARGGVFTVAGTVVNLVISVLGTVVITRLLAVSDFGIYGMAVLLFNFMLLFLDAGLSQAVIQQKEINHYQVSTLFWVNVGIAFLLAILTAGATPVLVWIFNEPRLIEINLVLSVVFVISAFTLQHKALLARRMKHGRLSVISFIAALVSTIVAVTIGFLGGGYWALVAMPLTNQIVTAIGMWLLCDWVPGLPRRGTGVRKMIAFGANITGFNFINYFARNTDNALLGYAWGANSLGLYTRAYTLIMLPANRLNGPITSVVVPALSRLVDDPQRYRLTYIRMLSMTGGILTIAITWAMSMVDILIPLLFGEQWIHMVIVTYALAPVCFASATNAANGWLYNSFGHVSRQLRWTKVHVPIIVLAAAIGVQWGEIGVALAMSISYGSLKFFGFAYATKGTPVLTKDFFEIVIQPILMCAPAMAIVLCYKFIMQGQGNVIVELIIRTLIYIFVISIVFLAIPWGRKFMHDIRYAGRILKNR